MGKLLVSRISFSKVVLLFASLSFLLSVLPLKSRSQHNTTAHVSYQKDSGEYSDYHYREVTVTGGSNLNEETGSYKYSSDHDYALLWFGQDEVAIVKLKDSSFTDITTPNIDESSFEATLDVYGIEYSGLDQSGRRWKVCFASKGMGVLCD